MSQKYFKLEYVPALDGLRGIAIIAVMIFHSKPDNTDLVGGFLGVDIFFVLSGFLITSLLIQEYDRKDGSINFKNFYMRRFLRLEPALLAMLIMFCFISLLLLNKELAQNNIKDAVIALAYVTNWMRAFELQSVSWFGHTWSLSVEENFYLVWPVLLLIVLRLSKNRYYALATVIAITIASWMWGIYLYMSGASANRLFNGSDIKANELLIGCILGIVLSSGLLSDRGKHLLQKFLMFVAPVSAICLLLAFCTIRDGLSPRMFCYG